MLWKKKLVIFLAANLLFYCSLSWADIAGKVVLAKGTVTATNAEGVTRSLQRRDEVYEQEVITTHANSRAQIRFIDNGMLTLQPSSQLDIKEYRLAQAGDSDSKVLLDLVEGGFRSLTGSIGKGTPEAYKVNTPVASIGIRGTLYSVQIQGDTLLAGVWQGGISLNTLDGGQHNLGLDSSYQFGRISASRFTGLLSAPAELDASAIEGGLSGETTSTNNDDSSLDSSESNPTTESHFISKQTGSLYTTTNENNLNIAPLDQQDEDALKETLSEAADPKPIDTNLDDKSPIDTNPIDTNPTPTQPTLISASLEEINLYNNSDFVAFAIDGTQALDGRLITNTQGEQVFISKVNDENYVLRFSDPAYTSNDGVQASAITVGAWLQSPTSYSGSVSEEYLTTSSSFFYYTGTPFDQSNPPTGLDSLTFNYAVPLKGYDSFGNELTSVSGSFEFNLGSGDIDDGSLSLIYEPSQGDYGTEWNIQFGGQWNNGPQVRLNILEAWVSLKKNGDSYDYGDIDAGANNNFLNLILTNDGDDYWALMLAQLNAQTDTHNENLSASGLLLWGNIPGFHSQLDPIDQDHYFTALQSGQRTYVALGDELFEGYRFEGASNSDMRFMSINNELFKYSGSITTPNATSSLIASGDWGKWNDSYEYYQDRDSDYSDASRFGGESLFFITATPLDTSAIHGTYEFKAEMSGNDLVALGKDSLGNPLTHIGGSLRVNLPTGAIHSIDPNGGVEGNLEFKYETNANAFTEWSFSLSGDINNIVVSPTSLTHNGSSGGFDSAQFNAFVIGQSAVEGVLSQHIFEGSSTAPIWANGLVVWKKTP